METEPKRRRLRAPSRPQGPRKPPLPPRRRSPPKSRNALPGPPPPAEAHDAHERQRDPRACRRQPPAAGTAGLALGAETLELGSRPRVLRVEGQGLLEGLGV